MKKYKGLIQEIPTHTISEFSQKRTKYCLIIPVINEGEKFKKQIKRLKPFSKIIDIIIADGGSTDGSTSKMFLRSQKVRALLVKTGEGKLGAQLRMAFLYALSQGYEGIVTMDGNGKDGQSAIPRFIKALDSGFDYVQASRFIKGGKGINTPLLRYVGIRFILSPILSLASRYWYTDVSNAFRAYSRRLLLNRDLQLYRNIFSRYEILFYITARTKQLGMNTKEIPAIRKYPSSGKTPTKIIGIRSYLELIVNCIRISQGKYNP